MKTNIEYMELALKEAKKAELMDEVPVGCIIVKDGNIIAKAHNLREKQQQATGHAEVLAIQKASKKIGDWNLTGCELFVTLEPCMMCAGLISQARISKICYGAKDPKGGAMSSVIDFKQIPHIGAYPRIIESGILEKECSEILTNYFKKKRV